PLRWLGRLGASGQGARSSNNATLTQSSDRIRIQAKADQHFVGVLAELRGRPHGLRLRSAAEVDGLTDDLDVPEMGMLHRPGDGEVAHLRLGERLIDAVDCTARDPSLVQELDPVGAGLFPGDLANALVQRIAVLRTQWRACKLGSRR